MSDAPAEGSPNAAPNAGFDAPAFDVGTIKTIAFDAYGTLFNFANTDFHRAVSVILAEQGIETDLDAFFEKWVGSYGQAAVWSETRKVGGRGAGSDYELNGPLPEWYSTHEIWRRQFGVAFDHFGLKGDGAAAADYLRHELSHVDPYPDAHDTVEALARQGYLLGLLSNADEDFLQAALSRARLRFSIIQTSESLRAYKPHRAIFEGLCLRAACEPHEVLYVGDSANSDIGGAQNVGMRCAWVRRDERPLPERLKQPDLVIDQLSELVPILCGGRS